MVSKLFCLLVLFCLDARGKSPVIEWTMINVNAGTAQADAHLVHFPTGENFLIDVGAGNDELVPFLKSQGIGRIDKIIITHAHRDHYGGILPLIAAGISVSEVSMNRPNKEACQNEKPWGCDWEDVHAVWKKLSDIKLSPKPINTSEFLYRAGKISLRVVYTPTNGTSPLGKTDINDESVILRLEHGKKSVLFSGDLNQKMGGYLAAHSKEIRADILKVPHHGTESVAPNSFFDAVAPKLALVPAPKALWESDRSARIKKYFSEKKIPVFVNGIHGHVRIEIGPEKFRVIPEKTRRSLERRALDWKGDLGLP